MPSDPPADRSRDGIGNRADGHKSNGQKTADAGRAARMRLGERISVRLATPDDFSNVRYLHAVAYRVARGLDDEGDAAERFRAHVYSPDYSAALAALELVTGWFDGTLVGTAAWAPADKTGPRARISNVYTAPHLARRGIARRLVTEVEANAHRAGYVAFTVRAKADAVLFFRTLGYQVSTTAPDDPSVPGPAGQVVLLARQLPRVDIGGR